MAVAEIKIAKPQTGFAEFWFYFSRNKGAVMGPGDLPDHPVRRCLCGLRRAA